MDNFYKSVETFQAILDDRLVHDNTEQPDLDYCNMARRPNETVMAFVNREG